MSLKKPKTIIVGDVHGCYDELLELLTILPTHDQLIFVGDLILKGPKSLAVMEKVLELHAQVVMGNNEFAFLQALTGKRRFNKEMRQLQEDMGEKLSYWQGWLEQLPAYIETADYLVVHAGLSPVTPPATTPLEILIDIRTWDGQGEDLDNEKDPAWFDLYYDQKLVVFGHWAKRGLIVRANAIGLDSGCAYGRELSAVVLPERHIVQVKAKRNYTQSI